MTPTSPGLARTTPVPSTGEMPLPGEVGPTVIVWYLAVCHRCGEDISQPFLDEDERDDWASRHVVAPGHTVQLTVDGLDEMPGLHMTGILRSDDDGGFKFLCPADDCKRWNGPYPTPQTAISAWRSHKPAADR